MPQTPHQPNLNHPWRQYRNKRAGVGEDTVETPAISLQDFLRNIVDNYDTYKIPPPSFEDREYIALAKLAPDKQAEWLISFLKKHWLGNYKGALILE